MDARIHAPVHDVCFYYEQYVTVAATRCADSCHLVVCTLTTSRGHARRPYAHLATVGAPDR